ncbi:hypothetical protein IGX29_15675 [Streptomyces sp. H28]|uniref:hypothetical protein n=1 Tax=Streptomyces sp. H28 TaxID=2775865 RepID=UPI001786DF66|nr:hypothetical protein [Streptomyces sp. H28]MBD9733218.1 hypothetical protein [Streptomyces sp. H28]
MSFGPQPRYGPPPHPDKRAVDAHRAKEPEEPGAGETARLAAGLRLGVRTAVVWFLFVLVAALLPSWYGTPVAGPVSLGAVLAVVPLAVGVHALVVHGRQADGLEQQPDDPRWSS